ncbi:Mov34/MPN/PAD-1 family protein [Variovorax sp. EBFNA2]|uniref:Mov34/MPN/PAD-1 family protein n=1 Tax=Variovorax sp. EBFNA2 TaxID=3342097 RepID=UPI0029BFB011|nr:Mov34/MPN/PAD-1 family protein [Variovorax boronicumulans]WPG36216.1 Mov34/MPN/PAD-1 family protein [Variovorax boronicumulans]
MQHYRQTWMFASEAGGQLFGTISSDAVSVEIATGPYPGDERSRCRYRSNSKAAQQAIEQQAKNGSLYLGEWHTHAEDRPSASSLDSDAMQRLIANSRLNSSALLMLIVGLKKTADGMALFTVTSDASKQWALSSGD